LTDKQIEGLLRLFISFGEGEDSMKRPARFALFVALVSAVMLIQPLAQISGAANQKKAVQQSQSQVQRLRQVAQGSVTVSAEQATGFADFVRVSRGGDLLPASTAAPGVKTLDFFDRFGGLLGITGDAQAQLVRTSSFTDGYGATHISYRQVYRGVPVFGGTLRAHLDKDDDLTAVNGTFVPDLTLGVTPRLSQSQAADRAIAAIVADPPRDREGRRARVSAGSLRVASTRLYVYRTGLVRGAPGTSQLVYQVEVTNGRNVRDFVFVNAHGGKIVNRYSAVHDALHRVLYEMSAATPPIWEEGDPFPGTLNQDQQNIVDFSGDSYYHFFNAFGRDSYDGAGAFMRSVNNDPTIQCPNANWNGTTTNYCNGVTADDVVAHEWGHAYTEFTHNLIYQWQPGALNESYSDIWGETVDMINGKGTDTPGGVRSDGACSQHTAPVPRLFINSPASIAGECAAAPAQFGPPLTETGVTGDVVLAQDPSDAAGPSTTDSCSPLTNAAEVAGNIALADRGTCGFAVKVKNAQNAGAIAVVIGNNAVGPPAPMGGVDPTITIPSVMIGLVNANMIKDALAGGETVNVTMRLGGATTEDSYRWLMGEDATAFGGAIRDMWTPTCLSDPGKVTDAEYHCAVTDGGGVHTNSGVPNHGYALLVDGGTYNGQTVNQIGLVKAAHLYWRAQSVYQTETTKFPDHADALEQSCSDLIGQPLEGLSTTPTPAGPSGESMTAADCAAVTAMIAAVELRTDPTEQCNFQPILAQNPPPLCAEPESPASTFFDDFEDGLGDWTLTNQGVFAGWPGIDWTQDSSLPGGRAGSAAFAENRNAGNCDLGAGDISGVMRMESPAIEIPEGNFTPRLAFDHYVATEALWDGGNLKMSVNGLPYTVVPGAAFTFNPYNGALNTVAQGNTNPLAGEPAFTGTDGGEVGGTWGQSQVDLSAAGASPGDTVRLRFDFGNDGCTGIDGWYVDDVHVYVCQEAPVAVDDSYQTDEDTPLSIDAPGVLGNDTDPEGGGLTAALESEPTNGTVVLNDDGSFLYTPNEDFEGEDSFTYRAVSALGVESAPATVTIAVAGANDAPTVTVAPGGRCLLISGAMNLSLSDPDTDARDLRLDATSSNTRLVPERNIRFTGRGADRTVWITPALLRSGTATITIEVSDGTDSSTTVITVIVGGPGSNTLEGTDGPDMIFGGLGGDTINAGGGDDLICAGLGDDTINGEDGADTMFGNLGGDTMTGGPGPDFFSGGFGRDEATDFNAGEGDTRDGT
jgi:Zn-dependent metalloprotease